MSQFEIIMPKLGESVQEATITRWFKKENDKIEEDESLLEIATDKVDSEIPSPVSGIVSKVLFKEGDKVLVGAVIAIIDIGGEIATTAVAPVVQAEEKAHEAVPIENKKNTPTEENQTDKSGKFFSPLVKSIAATENVSVSELNAIPGTGAEGRVTKNDILQYVSDRGNQKVQAEPIQVQQSVASQPQVQKPAISVGAEDEVIEMDRMRKIIADHMVMSVHTSPHVTNMVEADLTNIVLWRNRVKDEFKKRENENLTYLPVFLEAMARALKDYPLINASVDGYKIIIRKHINIGVAVALPTGNLIVPVIKDIDRLNLSGITKELNRLANNARINKLSPDDIQGGTFTVTNFGTFRNVMGVPIINQPQVAILGIGTIEKKPAVLETPTGDVIAIRHKAFISLTYDHRIIDGALGGAYLRKLADYLEAFDLNRSI
jgi:2-oxoglutarate dehydrogenase E2 component (dihydrolipoamide succinyltransferase)